jgi:F-type H+-transporting ATPase subunit a
VTFQPTKFIVLELLAAFLVGGTFIWLARKVQSGEPPRGRLWNLLEAFVVYLRDQVAKPAIGSHDYKPFVPFLLTLFFFILTMNLMGMFPLFGTPTGNISVTAALALSVFALVLFVGMKKLGVLGFWKAQVPHLGIKGPFGIVLGAGIWCIEVFGLFIKHMVLAVRLFANMFAGHLVLAVFVGFIGATLGYLVAWIVWPAAIGGSVAIGLLELLVAFIQAYVFTFLAALFIGAAVHPH